MESKGIEWKMDEELDKNNTSPTTGLQGQRLVEVMSAWMGQQMGQAQQSSSLGGAFAQQGSLTAYQTGTVYQTGWQPYKKDTREETMSEMVSNLNNNMKLVLEDYNA